MNENRERLRVGIIGATGMVGQRLGRSEHRHVGVADRFHLGAAMRLDADVDAAEQAVKARDEGLGGNLFGQLGEAR